MFRCLGRKAFTLVEMVTVMAIVGISMGIFYAVFFLNWQALDQYIASADMGQELTQIVDKVSDDARFSKQIIITTSTGGSETRFIDPAGQPLGSYIMRQNGEFAIRRGDKEQVLTNRLDFANSRFEHNGKSVLVTLALSDDILGRRFNLASQTEIFPRN
jgi:prepilin-type N-terminal cleavage/methylation domain-containing protein